MNARPLRLRPGSYAFRKLRSPARRDAYGEGNIRLSAWLLPKRNVSPRRNEGDRRACAFTPKVLRFPGSPVRYTCLPPGDRVSSLKFLQVQKRNVSPRHKGPNGSRYGTVVSRTASPVSAGEIDFFDTIFGNSTVLQTWLQPVSALPPMGGASLSGLYRFPDLYEAYRAAWHQP